MSGGAQGRPFAPFWGPTAVMLPQPEPKVPGLRGEAAGPKHLTCRGAQTGVEYSLSLMLLFVHPMDPHLLWPCFGADAAGRQAAGSSPAAHGSAHWQLSPSLQAGTQGSASRPLCRGTSRASSIHCGALEDQDGRGLGQGFMLVLSKGRGNRRRDAFPPTYHASPPPLLVSIPTGSEEE